MILVQKPTFSGSKVPFQELNGVIKILFLYEMTSNANSQQLFSQFKIIKIPEQFPFLEVLICTGTGICTEYCTPKAISRVATSVNTARDVIFKATPHK
jgi:MinD superfamily P-loop ATPase